MKIWFINQYAIPPSLGGLARHYYFAKFLTRKGHEVKIFTGSQIHNSEMNMIPKKKLFIEKKVDGFLYTFVRTCSYEGNGWKRIQSMIEFPLRIWRVVKRFEKPDILYASSPNPFVAVSVILLSQYLKVPNVIEIRDLWPESIVEYHHISRKNPVIKMLYQMEKWIYVHAGTLIFTMAGGKAYIREKGWEKKISGKKIHQINNGVDLEEYEYNRENYKVEDADLEDAGRFKIIYTGSIRKANHLGTIVECARILQQEQKNQEIRFLIWGEGNERKELEERCKEMGLTNISFKGKVEKKYIPYILSRADINLMHGSSPGIAKFGISPNKLFDYLASEKPVLSDIGGNYDLITKYQCGSSKKMSEPKDIVSEIHKMRNKDREAMGMQAGMCAKAYDYRRLTDQLEKILENALERV